MSLSELASFAISGSAATAVAALLADRAVPSNSIVGPKSTKSTKPTTAAGSGFVFFLAYYAAATTGLRLVGRHNPDVGKLASTRSAATEAFFIGATASICTRLFGPRDGLSEQEHIDAVYEAPSPSGDNGSAIPLSSPSTQPRRQHRWSRAALEDDLVLALDPGLTFCIHELLARLAAKRQWRRQTLRQQNASGLSAALTTFLLAATSKAIAAGATFPLYAASTAAEASRRRQPLVEIESDHENRILAVLWKMLHHPGGLKALYDGWLRTVASAALGHGLTMALQRALYGLVLRLVYSVTQALRNRQTTATQPRKPVYVDTETPRSAPEMPEEAAEILADEREQVTKAVETWLESTRGSSDAAPSKVSRDVARLPPSPGTVVPSKSAASNQQTWVEDLLTRQEGLLPASPDDAALVRYDATRRQETVVSRPQGTPRPPANDAASRTIPAQSGVGNDDDGDGAGSVIFNMISKSPRVVKR